jgi:hypothetical protein
LMVASDLSDRGRCGRPTGAAAAGLRRRAAALARFVLSVHHKLWLFRYPLMVPLTLIKPGRRTSE